MIADTFCVKDLDYGGEKSRRDSRQRAYIILAVVAAVIVYMMMQPANGMQPVAKRAKRLMSMVANVAAAKYAHQVYENVNAKAMILLIRDSAQRSASPEAKEAKMKQFEAWKASHTSGVVMIYSDSCGHCHKAMPAFSTATLDPKINAVMLSGDSLPMEYARDTLNLEYFPTFMVWKNGDLTQVASIDAAVAELAEVVESSGDGASSEDTSDLFAMF